MNVEWWGGEQSSPPADYKSALLDCRVQLGAPSPALLCFRFVWLYLKWLGSLLGWAGLPKGWPAALTTRRARRSRAQGHRACCKLLVSIKNVIFGRRPCGRLLPTTSRRSQNAECKSALSERPALLCFRFVWLYLKWLGSLLGWADLPNGWPAALTTRRARRSRAQVVLAASCWFR